MSTALFVGKGQGGAFAPSCRPNILIACEESQVVCSAFREMGYCAYSCDIKQPSGQYPQYHIQCDVRNLLKYDWDLLIAHPPCTYLSTAGARHLYKNGGIDKTRAALGYMAASFFKEILSSAARRICVENPTPFKLFGLPHYNQVIEPYFFGDNYKKRTCLWLKNLPPLCYLYAQGTNPIPTQYANWFQKGGLKRQENRSRTFVGIARAMASQWGGIL